jgi:hypothetical protein
MKKPVSIPLTSFFARGLLYPEDGGDKFLRNVGFTRSTRRHIAEDDILYFNHVRKSPFGCYIFRWFQVFIILGLGSV